ncbi:MAG: sigma-70 family RNA polymerase sigma factor [Niabella sp.]
MSEDKYAHIADDGLLQRYLQDNDNEWLGILLQRYTLLLFGLCMKYLKDEDEARDAVQQVFTKVISEVHKYKIDYFKSWLYTIARNHCLTLLRDRKKIMPATFTADNGNGLATSPDTRQELQEKELSLDVLEASLEELNDKQRICITLFYLQKKGYQQISEETSFSLGEVKSYIQNGKRNLKLIVEKKLTQLKRSNG